jgi:low temperature requirement protein LtrA
MAPRLPSETNRASTPLELFFDLCFVVAVASGAASLHHALADGDVGHGTVGFALVFFAIWWAWMNFSWFASAYDTDDVLYRLAVFVQITGALIFAAGVTHLFETGNAAVAVLGYVVMRLAMVVQWLRAAANDPPRRASCLRYAIGIAIVQVGWIVRLAAPADARIPTFLLLAAAELAVPAWAERHGATSWHPRHIAERYGLFTIIVLGESVLAASVGLRETVDAGSFDLDLAADAAGGLLVVFALWWVYFAHPGEAVIERANAMFAARPRLAFIWGYGHLVVFASAAAVGAGLQVVFDQATGHTELSTAQAAACVAVPVVVYLLSLWALNFTQKRPGPMRSVGAPLTATAVLAAIWSPQPVLVMGIIVAVLVAFTIGRDLDDDARSETSETPEASEIGPSER